MEDAMQDQPPFADRGRSKRHKHGYEPRETHDTGAILWITAVVVIVALTVLLTFSQNSLRNGGGPFVITPPSQITHTPAYGG